MSEGNGGGCAVVILGALALWYCSTPSTPPASTPAASFADTEDEAEESEAHDVTDDGATTLGGETRDAYGARQEQLGSAAETFHDDPCTVDCGGHEAGRRWAEARGITSEGECGGRSWSFREGCETYAREQTAGDEPED